MPPKQPCRICSGLKDEEHAFQKHGWEESNSSLPAAADQLRLVRDFEPYGSRKRQLLQCPECSTYYLFRSDYEYLVNGSEDEQWLTRLTQQQVLELLD